MNIDDALELLRNHTGDEIGDGESDEAIVDVESRLGIRLPESYRRFLAELGYAEIFGEELFSIYDEPGDMPCLGIIQQNIGKPHLAEGFLLFLTTDIDGQFFLGVNSGQVFLNDTDNKVAESFEDLIGSLLNENF